MGVSGQTLEHALELFHALGPIRRGRMFSGVALYVENDVMFAMISSSGTIYMKSDASTEQSFLDAGSYPFFYTRGGREQHVASLMSLPETALDDPDDPVRWATLSIGPARIAAEKKRAAKRKKAARNTLNK